VGLGIAAAELLLALAVSNHYRGRLSYRFWRRAHYLNFAVWSAATLHGLGSGTDRSSPWALALYTGAVAAVSAAVVWRIGRPRRVRRIASAAAAVAASLLVVILGTGPLRFRARPWNAASFSERLTGQITQLSGVSRGIVSMVGQGQGAQNVVVRADLLVAPRRLLRTAFQMEYLPSAELCTGNVTTVHATGFTAICRFRTGDRRHVHAEWSIGDGSQLSGVIDASRF
jgi:hypothetical protein